MGLLDALRPKKVPPPPRAAPTYRNGAVIDRIVREEGVDGPTAEHWFAEMLLFLDMCADSDRLLSPPEPVDRAWHAFLLHTRDYEEYCRERYGRLIHHQPSGQPDPAAYQRAWEFRSGSGTPDPTIWAVPVVVTTPDGGPAPEQSGDAPPQQGDGLGSADAASIGADAGQAPDPGSSSDSGSSSSDSGGGSSCSSGSSCGGSSCGGGSS